MGDYKHGIETSRSAEVEQEVQKASIAQAVVGTAPVNLLDDPMSAVNKPIIVTKKSDAIEKIGVCNDYEHYTLMQSYLASVVKYGVAPVVMINVLDPTNDRHVTAVAGEEFTLTNRSTKIEEKGILLGTLIVTSEQKEGKNGKDYVASFDSDGYVDIAIAKDGIFSELPKVTIAYTKLNPEGVTAEDIIGGTDENNVRTGIDLLDEVYPTINKIPAYIGAPKFSENPAVAAVLDAKAELVGDELNATAVIDIESRTTVKPEQLKDAKDKLGTFARHVILAWPKVIMAGNVISASADKLAEMQYRQINNGGVPTSIDNKDAMIDGICLEDGTRRIYTRKQINNYAVANGITSYIYNSGWKSWGDNSAAFPDKTDPNDKSIKCVAVSNYLENRFKTEYASQIGEDTSLKKVDSVINNFNYMISGLIPDYLAGGEIILNRKKTTAARGILYFVTNYADCVPTEYMHNEFIWKQKIIDDAFAGGENE